MISLLSALMRQFEERGPIDEPSEPTNAPYVLGVDLNRSESGCRRSFLLALPTQPSINNTDERIQPSITASRRRGERVTRKPRVVTFRLDAATWDRMRELVPYTKYRNASSFIREGIELLLKREDEQPSGWTVGRPRRR
jgi:hypothetical protein